MRQGVEGVWPAAMVNRKKRPRCSAIALSAFEETFRVLVRSRATISRMKWRQQER